MSVHMISTPARRAACPTCGALVLAAIAEGIQVAVDPVALDLGTEITARLAGRMTFTVYRTRDGVELAARNDPGRVRVRDRPVFAEHPCPQAALAAVDPGEQYTQPTKYRRKSNS